jgi:hypothetical protein
MVENRKKASDGRIHHGMPAADFMQAFGKTLSSQNEAVADYIGRRMNDNVQTAVKLAVCMNPAEAFSTITDYWQRVGRDNTALANAMFKTPVEVEQEVKDLMKGEAEVLAHGKEEIFENSPV